MRAAVRRDERDPRGRATAVLLAGKGVEWDDLGEPSRAVAARQRSAHPALLQAVS